MKEEKFYIEVKHYNKTIRFTIDHSDISFEELIELFRKMAVSMGYHIDTVREYFG